MDEEKSEHILRVLAEIYSVGDFRPSEIFLLGVLFGYGAEGVVLDRITPLMDPEPKDMRNPIEFIKESQRIIEAVHNTDVKVAAKLLRRFLIERNAEVPKWLEHTIQGKTQTLPKMGKNMANRPQK